VALGVEVERTAGGTAQVQDSARTVAPNIHAKLYQRFGLGANDDDTAHNGIDGGAIRTDRRSVMDKDKKRVPSALRHGIYSAIGLLPTEDPAEFEKFKLEIVDEYKPAGRSEIIIVEEIACLQWRLQHRDPCRV
jgi:hypothetical protein